MDQSALAKKIQSEVDVFKSSQREFSKLLAKRQTLDGQLNENKTVLDELKLLDTDNKVYKLFGPILVKQELEESRQNVAKRIDYINNELIRCHEALESLEREQDDRRDSLQKLQGQYQMMGGAK